MVRPLPDVPGAFEIVAGERRWRAAQRAGLDEVPVVVVEIDDRASLEFAILENVQRADLNPIEEASGYERLMRDFSYTQRELAEILGKSRSHLANTLRLLNLPGGAGPAERGRDHRRPRPRPSGPARSRGCRPPHRWPRGCRCGRSRRWRPRRPSRPRRRARPPPPLGRAPLSVRALEHRIHQALGVGVSYRPKDDDSGEIRLRYASRAELQGLLDKLRVSADD